MSRNTQLRLAVLIDADNVSINALRAVLPDIRRLGVVTHCKIYGNLPKKRRPVWIAAIEEDGGLPAPCFKHRVGQNAADFALTIDAVALSHTERLGGACLLSSDGDFSHLVRSLREYGLRVHVFGARHAAKSLKRAADTFHPIEALGVRPAARAGADQAPPPCA